MHAYGLIIKVGYIYNINLVPEHTVMKVLLALGNHSLPTLSDKTFLEFKCVQNHISSGPGIFDSTEFIAGPQIFRYHVTPIWHYLHRIKMEII